MTTADPLTGPSIPPAPEGTAPSLARQLREEAMNR